MKTKWTRKMVRTLKAEYATCESLKELADRLGVSVCGLRSKAQSLHVLRRDKDFYWTEKEDDILRQMYAETPMPKLKELLQRSQSAIQQRAIILGLRRSKEYLAEVGRKNAEHPNQVACRFKKGQTPFNKGLKEYQFRSKEASERCKATQFKAGQLPRNTQPVGYECTRSDGYVYIKVKGERKMQPKHRYVWKQHHGAVPDGMCVSFRDGDRTNCDITNLMLITESEKATRVTASLTPEQNRKRIERATATRNEGIRKDKLRIRWGFEPKGKLVKKWYAPEK